jgi:hypothetical protein
MSIPGFKAEDSVYKRSKHYTITAKTLAQRGGAIYPAANECREYLALCGGFQSGRERHLCRRWVWRHIC